MPDFYNSIPITTTARTICETIGAPCADAFDKVNPVLKALINKKLPCAYGQLFLAMVDHRGRWQRPAGVAGRKAEMSRPPYA